MDARSNRPTPAIFGNYKFFFSPVSSLDCLPRAHGSGVQLQFFVYFFCRESIHGSTWEDL
jgi:hypothetical protein